MRSKTKSKSETSAEKYGAGIPIAGDVKNSAADDGNDASEMGDDAGNGKIVGHKMEDKFVGGEIMMKCIFFVKMKGKVENPYF